MRSNFPDPPGPMRDLENAFVMNHWHIALTEDSRYDLDTAEALRDRGYLVYNPRCPRKVYWGRNRYVRRVRAMFPGYLFVDEPVGQNWRRLETCPGIRPKNSLLHNGEGYRILPSGSYEEIRKTEISLMRQIDENSAPPPFPVGSEVFIQSGPFAGYFARVGDLDDTAAVGLLLDIFGRESRVPMPANWLTAASS